MAKNERQQMDELYAAITSESEPGLVIIIGAKEGSAEIVFVHELSTAEVVGALERFKYQVLSSDMGKKQ